MSAQSTRTSKSVERFWDKYLNLLGKKGVKQAVARWYVIRAEQYVQAHHSKKPAEHDGDDIANYQKEIEGLGRIQDWQFRQIVDALQQLFLLVEAPWAVKSPKQNEDVMKYGKGQKNPVFLPSMSKSTGNDSLILRIGDFMAMASKL